MYSLICRSLRCSCTKLLTVNPNSASHNLMSEHEWRPSPSPVEDWGEDDLEWEVDRIVGESIDAFSEKRYEVLHVTSRPSPPLSVRLMVRGLRRYEVNASSASHLACLRRARVAHPACHASSMSAIHDRSDGKTGSVRTVRTRRGTSTTRTTSPTPSRNGRTNRRRSGRR